MYSKSKLFPTLCCDRREPAQVSNHRIILPPALRFPDEGPRQQDHRSKNIREKLETVSFLNLAYTTILRTTYERKTVSTYYFVIIQEFHKGVPNVYLGDVHIFPPGSETNSSAISGSDGSISASGRGSGTGFC